MGVWGWDILADDVVLRGTFRSYLLYKDDGDWTFKVEPSESDQYLLKNPNGDANWDGCVECEVEPPDKIGGQDAENQSVVERYLRDIVGCEVVVTGTWSRDRSHTFDNKSIGPLDDGDNGKTEIHPVVLLLAKTPSDDRFAQEFRVFAFSDDSSNLPNEVPHSDENRLATFTMPVAHWSTLEILDEVNQAASREFEIVSSAPDWMLHGNVWPGRASEGKGFYHCRLRVQAMRNEASGSLVQSTFGKQGNYELVVALGDHLAHYWRDNDSPDYAWHGPVKLKTPSSAAVGHLQPLRRGVRFTGVSLLQSTIGPGNLEVLARGTRGNDEDSVLFFYGRDAAGWHDPQELKVDGQPVTGVTGTPGLVQSTFGKQGNYELVVALGDHLAHYWRDNDSPDYAWHGPVKLKTPSSAAVGHLQPLRRGVRFTGVSLLQSTIGPGNLEVLARGTRGNDEDSVLFFYGRDAAGWHDPQELKVDGQPVTGVTGTPGLVQSTFGKQGNYELVVALGDHLAHYWRDNDSPDYAWHGPVKLKTPSSAAVGHLQPLRRGVRFTGVSLLQSTIGPGNLEVLARGTRGNDEDSVLFFYGRDAAGWHDPQELKVDGQPVTGVTG